MKIGGFYLRYFVKFLTKLKIKAVENLSTAFKSFNILSTYVEIFIIEQQYSQLMLLLHHDVILLVLLQNLEHELVQLIQIYDDLMIR